MMRRANDPQEFINLIILLEQALLFYASDENHIKKNLGINNELSSMVELDKGHHAKFALDRIKEFNFRYDGIDDNLEKFKIQIDSMDASNAEEVINMLKTIKYED
jgi:hypothetical protein